VSLCRNRRHFRHLSPPLFTTSCIWLL